MNRPANHPLTLSSLTDGGKQFLEVPRVWIRVDGETDRVPLGLHGLRAGSSPECDLVIADGQVSRVHCELRLEPGGVAVKDLGSKNGTFLRGVRVEKAYVPPGEAVELGQKKLLVEHDGAASRVEVPAIAQFGEAVGSAVTMRLLFDMLQKAAGTDAPVLLLGESGTGKDVLARAVHAQSARKDGPFIVFDCSAVAPSLVETELFGHAKGAFTGAATARRGMLEEAHRGTLFLDEIGELPLELQSRLLRLLETQSVRPVGANDYRSVDVRVIAATHRDLQGRVRAGTFRRDLYFRLAVVTAHVPPLRERKEDIPLLVQHFLARQSPARSLGDLPQGALQLLETHDWPGNVRELWNTVTRLVLFPGLGKKAIQPAGPKGGRPEDSWSGVSHLPLREAREFIVQQFEEAYLIEKLEEHRGNVAAAAQAMGVSRQFLYRLLHRYHLKSDAPPDS